MAKLTRRKLIAGAAVAPLAGAAGTPAAVKADPLVARVRAWIGEQNAADALTREWQWQLLEHALFLKCKPMTLPQATRSGMAEARAMRALEQRMKAASRKLDRAGGRLVQTRAVTAARALAKIEMGLKIQEPLDCEEYSWALIKGRFEDLRQLL